MTVRPRPPAGAAPRSGPADSLPHDMHISTLFWPRLGRAASVAPVIAAALWFTAARVGAQQRERVPERLAELSLADSALMERTWVMVLRSNPELRARRAFVDAARARVAAAGFAAPAVLSAETDDADGLDITAGSPRFEISRELLTGARKNAARAFEQVAVQGAEADLRTAKRVIAARLGRALAGLAGWASVARRLASEDSLLASAEESLRDRFAVGDARYTDVLRLRTERLRVQTDRAAAVTETRVHREALTVLAGVGGVETDGRASLDSIIAAAASTPIAVRATLPAAPDIDSLLARSGEVRRALAELARARAERLVLEAGQRPRISAGLGAQVVAEGDGTGRTLAPAVSVAISLP